jgi:signal transduction histidine kinase/DNA-binding NarL/FixJ family response regulator/HPt (histidine-containing phosphotransfer) domain-containing protein
MMWIKMMTIARTEASPICTTAAGKHINHLDSMRALLMLALAWQLLFHPAFAQADAGPAILNQARSVNLLNQGLLFEDRGEAFPASRQALPGWLAALKPAAGIDLSGGAYWMVARVRNGTGLSDWVLDPNDTLIERVEARLIGSDGSVQRLVTGYRAPHDYMLHYGKDVTLGPNLDYQVVLRFSSPYYARQPVISLLPQAQFRALSARENVLIVGSLGALFALAVFNFFIYSITRDRSPLYYSIYVLTYAAGWALAFHLPVDLFGWRVLELHYVPFFLLPVFSTLFYLHFLRLKELAPRLAGISRINLVLPLVLLPSCFFALGWAHTLATIAILIWIALALACGIVAWKRGHRPARFFVFGFMALLLPSLAILPTNLGLLPAMVGNAQLLVLLGGTLDGLLLAFALADQIRILRDNLEQNVDERTMQLRRANDALTIAKEHAEVVSRHRIDFLSAMSHDIRTPVAGMIGMLKFALRDHSVNGRTEEYLRIGLHNGESLLAILNDILDFSKIDAGKLTLEKVSFRLADLIGDPVSILQGQADAKSLLLRSEIGPGLPEFIEGDPTRLRQILINLLGNAIKFTERGEVLLQVGACASAGLAPALTFSVNDTGPGIAPEVRARLFEKFEQADRSTTRRYGGTGLGLAICKELVGLMGGHISVESRVGAGSRFMFTLPLVAGGAPPADLQAKVRERHSHQLRVLCAEDVRTNQIIIGTLLENMGHQVHIVENGVEALHALGSADFDLVLMDGRMPLMDGEQATRLIRSGGSEGAPVRDACVPIVALTANASEPDCARYLAAGMNGFLSKPIDERALYDQIESIIAGLLAGGQPLRSRDAAPAAPLSDIERELALQFGVAADPGAVPAAAPLRVAPLAGFSPIHIERIATAFVQEAPRRLALARAALDSGDGAALAAAFHAIKGSAGYLSSSDLHSLAARMETLAADGRLDAVALEFAQVEEALSQAIGSLGQASIS